MMARARLDMVFTSPFKIAQTRYLLCASPPHKRRKLLLLLVDRQISLRSQRSLRSLRLRRRSTGGTTAVNSCFDKDGGSAVISKPQLLLPSCCFETELTNSQLVQFTSPHQHTCCKGGGGASPSLAKVGVGGVARAARERG